MAKKRPKRQPEAPVNPLEATEKDFLADIGKSPNLAGVYSDWLTQLEEDIQAGTHPKAPEQMARLEFIRIQKGLKETPFKDQRRIKALKQREQELTDQWGQAWTQKDLAAAGFTAEQLEGIEPKWVPFSGGFSLLLIEPRFLEHVKATHGIMLSIPDESKLSQVLINTEHMLERARLQNEMVSSRRKAALQDRPNYSLLLDNDFWNSGHAVNTLITAGFNPTYRPNSVDQNILEFFVHLPGFINAPSIKTMISAGADFQTVTGPNGRQVPLVSLVHEMEGYTPQTRSLLHDMRDILKDAGAKTRKELRLEQEQRGLD